MKLADNGHWGQYTLILLLKYANKRAGITMQLHKTGGGIGRWHLVFILRLSNAHVCQRHHLYGQTIHHQYGIYTGSTVHMLTSYIQYTFIGCPKISANELWHVAHSVNTETHGLDKDYLHYLVKGGDKPITNHCEFVLPSSSRQVYCGKMSHICWLHAWADFYRLWSCWWSRFDGATGSKWMSF